MIAFLFTSGHIDSMSVRVGNSAGSWQNQDCVRSTMLFLSGLLAVKQKGQLQQTVSSACSSSTRMLRKEGMGAKRDTGRGNSKTHLRKKVGEVAIS